MAWSALPAAARFLLGAVFLMAGITKTADQDGFALRVRLHSGLPGPLAEAGAALLPWLELTCGFCLVLGTARREAAALLAAVLLFVSGYTLLHRGATDCGCFLFPEMFPDTAGVGWRLGRNAVLFLFALAGALERKAERTGAAAFTSSSGPPATTAIS